MLHAPPCERSKPEFGMDRLDSLSIRASTAASTEYAFARAETSGGDGTISTAVNTYV